MGGTDSKCNWETQYMTKDQLSRSSLRKIPYNVFLHGLEEQLREWNELLHDLKSGVTSNNKRALNNKLRETENSLRKYNSEAVIHFPTTAWGTKKTAGTTVQSSSAVAGVTSVTRKEEDIFTDEEKNDESNKPPKIPTNAKGSRVSGLAARLQKQEATTTQTQNTATTDANEQNLMSSTSDPSKQVANQANEIKLEEKVQTLTDQLEEERYNIAELNARILTLRKTNAELSQEKDDLLTRLSKIAGEKLTKGNPNIADLNDKNRPTKLGEMFSQLYDDEWTDAFEVLEEAGYSEENAVKTLLDTLESVQRFCEKKADLLLKNTENAINHLFAEYKKNESSPIKTGKGAMTFTRAQGKQIGRLVTTDDLRDYALVDRWKPKSTGKGGGNKHIKKQQVGAIDIEDKMKDLRKEVSESIVPMVQQAYFETRWDGNCLLGLEPYIKKCIYICWMMMVQSPPMCLLHANSGERFDQEAFASYTQNGPTIEYVVWPPLQLHTGGPLVAKGVAQGKKENKPN